MKREHSCVEVDAARGQVMDLLRKARENFLEKRDETKYVELELEEAKARGGNAQHEPRSGGRTQMPHSGGGASATEEDGRGEAHPSFPPCLREPEDSQEPGESKARAMTHPDVSKRGEDRNARAEESHDGGNYLSGRSESDDYEDAEDVSVVLSDDSGPRATENESHYITTHEIQLSELSDHEGDFDLGMASSSSSWDIEDDHRAYAFVDYAFASDGARESGDARPPPRAQGAAAVSTMLESDPTKSASSDESASKPQQEQQARGGTSAGQIHLSIKPTSRAINEPSSVQDQENILYHAARPGDMSRYVLRGVDRKAETLCDRAKCFIAAPGRVHFGGKFRGKEVTEYSSGTSSAVSELDDADKEVRNLTARGFKSLAYPYFDAINFSTSSESSASERGLAINRWSTFVDLKYGNVNMSQGLDQSLVSCQKSFEIAKNIDKRDYKGFIKAPGSNIFTLNGNPKQIQLMGQFGQGPGGVIRLTETLNFRCNVKSGMSAGERRAQFAQNAAGSRSADEVTGSLLSGQRGSPCKTMEDTQKKAVFASSLIKNVISKKMQFEQERKMERGEIVEPRRAPSPGCVQQESEARARELQRQSSRFSESSSDFALMCVDELGDIVDGGSCPAAGTNLEPARGGGMDAKKGALEASKSTLLRSQNSAFRCWKDGDLGFQKDHKSVKTLEDKLLSARDRQAEAARDAAGLGKPTKMSHLFVPSIQLLPSDGDDPRREDGGGVMRSDNTLYITDSGALATSKSPEIKINLRSVRERKTEPFGASRPRAPNLGSGAAGLIRADEFKRQALAAALKAEPAEKVPHFTVRDIRDNRAKLQTPIHQVRDVRKLVKSSYHFVSLDNSESRSADSHAEQKRHSRTPHPVSPIVIKCQSVNTNNAATEAGNAEPPPPEGAKVARAPGVKSMSPSEGSVGLKKQEKAPDVSEKKPETMAGNRAALEKLQAAVKTMEQLYVFEKNEWRRKNEPRRLDGSHVMSLIARQEQDGPPEDGAGGPGARRDSCPGGGKTSPGLESLMREDLLRASSSRGDWGAAKSTPSRAPGAAGVRQQGGAAPPKTFPPESPKRTSRADEPGDGSADSENYLTIPVKPKPSPSPPPPPSQTKRSSIVMETRSPDTPPASIYHSMPQLYCFSPALTPALTPGPGPDAFQPTQRKVLLDPATGSYYLVDAPLQPPARRLFDPETGQYVDVPMTPVPVSPLALGPAPYGHAYMIYPGFMPAPALVPARTLAQSRPSDADDGEKASQQAEGVYMEPPLYMATGVSPQQGAPQQVGRPHGFAAVKQPVISISPQQGPCIIAPPSFNGTTMSFVVEHR